MAYRFNPKRLFVSLSILAGLIILLVTLSFTLFAPNKIEVNFMTTTENLTGLETEIIKEADIKGSVFFFNRRTAKTKVEEKFPYAEVVNFEIKFPYTVVIHIGEREPLFSVNYQGNILIVDKDMKILEINSVYPTVILNVKIKDSSYIAGKFLQFETPEEKTAAENLFVSIAGSNRTSAADVQASFKEIKLTTEQVSEKTVVTLELFDYNYFRTMIIDYLDKPDEKINKMFISFSSIVLTPADYQTKFLLIYTDKGNIKSVLVNNE